LLRCSARPILALGVGIRAATPAVPGKAAANSELDTRRKWV